MIFLSRFFDFYDNTKEKILSIIDKTLLFFMHRLNLLHLYIVNRFGLNTTTYQFLTANDKAENIAEYAKALNDALKNNKVKNIAISGSYGSGKSSFIKTFETNNPQYKFLDISLATFKSNTTTDLSLIEKSILEQMFYRVKNTTIPQSRLKKINRLKWMPIKIVSVFLVILSFLILFQSHSIKTVDSLKILLEINSNDYLKYLPIAILLFGFYYIANKLLTIMSNTNIEKLSLQNLELKSNSDSASLLNQYLDEILYFFEKTHFDVVVFQDLDRFENLDIFTKLRELNNFVNNSEQIDRKIAFIYAVKDEIFKNADERTKFFDFLIPIIPYINATNSKDVLIDYFENIEKSFLYDISLYISDMRLLKNIYNEYLIYSSSLDTKLDKTKLLAIIIYKNFEPQDFEELHKCKGLVYDIFHTGKKEYLKLHITKIENKIIDIKGYIKEIEEEPNEDIKELRQLYILKIIENSSQQFNKAIFTSTKSFTIQNSIEDDNFQFIIESDGLGTYNHQSHYLNVKFVDIEKGLGSYKKRSELILNKRDNKKNTLLKEIEDLKKEQERLKDISLKELFEEFNDVTIFENIVQEEKDKERNKKFDNSELMKYLLSYGHIDENYEEYISNFFGVSITKDEQEFLRNVKNSGKSLPFDYELKHLDEIVDFRLSINEFSKESVLNLNLMNYLLENKSLYSQQIEKLFLQLSTENERSNEFILYCLDYCNQRKEFVSFIVKFYQKFWFLLMNNRADKLITYFGWVIHYSEYEYIKNLNYNNCLKEYLVNVSSIQEFSGSEAKKVTQLIKNFDIKFIRLDLTNSFEIVNFIFENSCYALEPYMINKIIFTKCAPQSSVEEDLKYAHLTTIKSDKLLKGKEVLLAYINDNINEYVENIFLRIDTNTKESEESLIELLNIDSLNENLKFKIIEKEEVKIINIDSIDKTLWEQLIRQNKLVSSWDNAFKYFNDSDTNNDLLINYLNIEENAKKISEIRCGGDYEKKNEFFNAKLLKFIIETNLFNILSYEYLIKNLGYWYADLDISKLDKNKISLLIKYGRFQFKKACFDALKEKDGNLHIALIEKNKDKLLEEFENFQFDTDDIVKILEIDKSIVSDAIKKDCIEKIDYVLIANKSIAKLIYKYVDRTNIKPIEYTKKMLQHLESLESKINLIIEQNNELDDNDFVQFLDFLPEEYSKIKNFDGKQTVLKDNYYNRRFIEILKDRSFITSDKPEKKDQIRLYIKTKSE